MSRATAELLDGARDQLVRLVSPTSERVGGAESCCEVRCPVLPQVETKSPLENPSRVREIPATEVDETEGEQCVGQREGMIGLLSDPHGGFRVPDGASNRPSSESTSASQAPEYANWMTGDPKRSVRWSPISTTFRSSKAAASLNSPLTRCVPPR